MSLVIRQTALIRITLDTVQGTVKVKHADSTQFSLANSESRVASVYNINNANFQFSTGFDQLIQSCIHHPNSLYSSNFVFNSSQIIKEK